MQGSTITSSWITFFSEYPLAAQVNKLTASHLLTFAPPEVVPGTLDPELGFSGSQQGLYMKKLAVNAKGDVAIVNSTFRPNRSSHIWLIRGRITGR